MKIYIPTVGRVGKQRVADYLRYCRIPYQLVVRPDETKAHGDHPVLVCKERGIRATRQWLLDRHKADKLLIFDDDLTFWWRTRDGKKFIKCDMDPTPMKLMVKEIEHYLNKYAHGGIVEKFMSQSRPRGTVHGGRYFQVLAYNTALFPTPKPRMRVEIGEDMDMNLQLLYAGKQNFILTEYTKTDKEWSPGGCCMMGRNEKTLYEQSAKLAKLHPGVVTLKDEKKEGTHNWLKISWRKAQKLGGLR